MIKEKYPESVKKVIDEESNGGNPGMSNGPWTVKWNGLDNYHYGATEEKIYRETTVGIFDNYVEASLALSHKATLPDVFFKGTIRLENEDGTIIQTYSRADNRLRTIATETNIKQADISRLLKLGYNSEQYLHIMLGIDVKEFGAAAIRQLEVLTAIAAKTAVSAKRLVNMSFPGYANGESLLDSVLAGHEILDERISAILKVLANEEEQAAL